MKNIDGPVLYRHPLMGTHDASYSLVAVDCAALDLWVSDKSLR